jgi:hypothetical protein
MPPDVPPTKYPFSYFLPWGVGAPKTNSCNETSPGFEVELPPKRPEQLICIAFTPAYTQCLIFTTSLTPELYIPLRRYVLYIHAFENYIQY